MQIIFSENCRVFTEYLEYPDATPLMLKRHASSLNSISLTEETSLIINHNKDKGGIHFKEIQT